VGGLSATKSELAVSRWFEVVGWYDLDGVSRQPTCLPQRYLTCTVWRCPSEVDLGNKPHAAQQFHLTVYQLVQPDPLQAFTANAAACAYWGNVLWRARHHEGEPGLRSPSPKRAWEVFWQATFEPHDLCSGGSQALWRPGFTKMQ
jgi:hypothetical protein